MILAGTLHHTPEPATVSPSVNGHTLRTSAAAAAGALARLRRNVQRINVTCEVMALNTDQVWALFYVRGGQDPTYDDTDAVDGYLRVLSTLPGERGAAARDGFLRGWVEHHSHGPAEPVVWHRFIGDTAIQVHPEVTR